jgi:hypothetical protein
MGPSSEPEFFMLQAIWVNVTKLCYRKTTIQI